MFATISLEEWVAAMTRAYDAYVLGHTVVHLLGLLFVACPLVVETI